ncbi:MAG: hypothetical protein AAGF24_10420, partial [Cyanobacteria bacterium P01_H01_bin.121]
FARSTSSKLTDADFEQDLDLETPLSAEKLPTQIVRQSPQQLRVDLQGRAVDLMPLEFADGSAVTMATLSLDSGLLDSSPEQRSTVGNDPEPPSQAIPSWNTTDDMVSSQVAQTTTAIERPDAETLQMLIDAEFGLTVLESLFKGATETSNITPAELRLRPRALASYTTSQAGTDGYGAVGVFLPTFQTPATNVAFVEGQTLLDNGAQLGGTATLGLRGHLKRFRRTLGAYASFDNRSTGAAAFNQIGIGLESLGQRWDAHLNGYIPIGATEQAIAAVTPQETQAVQAAIGRVELEVGRTLANSRSGSSLRAYLSPYLLASKSISPTYGVRSRLAFQPRSGVELGASIQYDEVFGVNFAANVAIGLPVKRTQGFSPAQAIAVMQLNQIVQRDAAIKVINQVIDTQD